MDPDIEITAVEMVWDTILRFSQADLPKEFYSDFVRDDSKGQPRKMGRRNKKREKE
jgi:hypothetical protein